MKRILFTGARSGIASSVIDRLLSQDYYIYVTVHTDIQLEYAKKKYEGYQNVECLKLDITDEKDRQKLGQLEIDILVNNAAVGHGGSISEIPMDKVRDNFEVNVFSTFEVVQIVMKNMMRKKSGKIIMISSLFGIIPVDFLGAYCATKASVNKLTTTLKNELKLLDENIKIVLIQPGMYHTGFNQVMLENKYDWMKKDSYFKSEIEYLRKKETMLCNIFEKRSLRTITNKIEKAIKKENPKFIYRTPFSQVLISKFYELFFQ